LLRFTDGFLIVRLITDQRNLGMSMKVERSSLEQVRKRFEMNKKKLEEKKKEYDFEERIKELKEEVRALIELQMLVLRISEVHV